MPFFELYCQGKAQADDIDDYVDRWHDGSDKHAQNTSLHDYLGLMRADYDRWVQAPTSLADILAARGGPERQP
jgi:hypothetical protein